MFKYLTRERYVARKVVLTEQSSKERSGDKLSVCIKLQTRCSNPNLRSMMNTSSLKGAGKLSRKLLTILMVAAMPTLGYAVDNSIFIDQTGSNAVVNITQDGAGNTVKGIVNNAPGVRGIDAAILKGDSLMINIDQVGSGNTLSLGVDSIAINGYRNPTVSVSTTANNTSAFINMKGGQSNLIDITQTGNTSSVDARVIDSGRSVINVNSAGIGDAITSLISGSGDSSTNITLPNTGGGNLITTTTQGGGGTIVIGADGTGNTIGVDQNGVGNTALVKGYDPGSLLTGNDNIIRIVQNGNSNTAGVNITGSSNSVAINQGSASDGQEAKIKISGSGNAINVSQGQNVPLLLPR